MIRGFQRLLREPLLHFFVLGSGIFLLFGLVGDSDESQPAEIVVTVGQIERLVEGWKKTRMRAPTAPELEGLIANHIREEIYYREALAMGLDSDDTIIRRRLRQKMEFLTEDLVTQVKPTEAELQTFLHDNPDSFRIEPQVSFYQIYFSSDLRGTAADSDALQLLTELRGGDDTIDIKAVGDPLPLPSNYESATEFEVRSLFGSEFATRLLTLEEGSWQGPVASAYGLHLVLIRERTPSAMPELDEVREAVAREWREVRRRAGNEKLYELLREQYTVVIERPEWLDADADLTAADQ